MMTGTRDRIAWSAEADEQGAPEGVPVIEKVSKRAYRSVDCFYVRSGTTRGKFYRVMDGVCSCKGFAFSHSRTCQHVQHLVDAGWLVPDPVNGGWRNGRGGNPERDATQVTTGVQHSLDAVEETVAAREAQIRRLQAYAVAQRQAMVAQHRMLTAMKDGNDWSMRRLSVELDEAYEKVRAAGKALRKSDLAEVTDG